MSKKFDKKINQKISEAEITPSAGLWDKIEAELPEEKHKKGFFLLPLFGTPMFKTAIAASVMFLLGGFSTYYFMNNNSSNLGKTEKTQENKTNLNTNKQNQNITEQKTLNKTAESLTTQIQEEGINTSEKKDTKYKTTTNSSISINTALLAKGNINTREQSNSNNNNNILFVSQESSTSSNIKFGTSARDYEWIYDKATGAYHVQSKALRNTISSNQNSLMANETSFDEDNESETSFMSIIEEKQEEENPEILEENEDEPVLKAFNSKSNRINYQGFWLGPQVGFEGVFVADEFYAGGSFGVDFGYDFGSHWSIQTGLKYAINSKTVQIEQDGNMVAYESEFNSFHIPLYARYKFTKLLPSYSRPLSLNFIGGLDYAYADRKKLHQLGINLGAEYDIFTQADLMFTVGVKGGMYNNLNLFKIDAPEKINRYNYLLSAYLSVRFIDWAKKN